MNASLDYGQGCRRRQTRAPTADRTSVQPLNKSLTGEALQPGSRNCNASALDRMNAIYLNETPIRLAERQATRQSRFVGSGLIWSVKSSGIPTGLATSRQAPVSDKLRTRQSTVDAAPKIIDPPLSVRTRGLARFSIIRSD